MGHYYTFSLPSAVPPRRLSFRALILLFPSPSGSGTQATVSQDSKKVYQRLLNIVECRIPWRAELPPANSCIGVNEKKRTELRKQMKWF